MKQRYIAYSPEYDMSFIMEDILGEDDYVISTEVKGFFFGKEEDQQISDQFYGKLKATFEN